MTNLTNFNPDDYSKIVDRWLSAEKDGTEFPVEFEIAWKLAGYARKDHAKRRITSKSSYLKEGRDYLPTSGEWLTSGRSSDSMLLTCDAFKHFCLMAETEQGEQIRQYFIESEKKW